MISRKEFYIFVVFVVIEAVFLMEVLLIIVVFVF